MAYLYNDYHISTYPLIKNKSIQINTETQSKIKSKHNKS